MPDFQAELVRALPGTLREHSVRRGGKTAYRDARRAVTYRELEERTGRLAGHLARLGERVAVHLGNRVEVVEACLGALRAAAVGVMLNTGAFESELAHFLDDSGASVVITEVELLPPVLRLVSTRPGTRVVAVGRGAAARDVLDFEQLAGTEPGCPPRDDLGLDDPAWILYTSGTTGESKGVVSTQRSALWSVAAAYVPAYGLEERDQLLWPLSMFHCYAHSLCLLGVVSVGSEDADRHELSPLRPATGAGGPALVCVPGFAPGMGRPWHAGLAACFDRERDVFELRHPGVDDGDAVARDLHTLAGLHAATVRRHLGGRPYVGVGHSMDGTAAHAVTERLVADGTPPAGLVLVDSYHVIPDREAEPWLLALPARLPLAMGERFDDAVDDLTLLSMGAYTRMIRAWEPPPTGVPTLLVRATRPLPGMPELWRSAWLGTHDTVDVPGSHLSMLEEDARTTAAESRDWTGGLRAAT
ncbi:AMP-binding protein [Streptomyces collinus]